MCFLPKGGPLTTPCLTQKASSTLDGAFFLPFALLGSQILDSRING